MWTISYPLLQSPKSQIRLVCLQPGEWTDPLSISLQIFSLHTCNLPFFEAVSYTWGDPSNKKLVICSGASISITESAENVLRRFRLARSSRYGKMDIGRYLNPLTSITSLLWIDMICINQNDSYERNDQVQLMGLIYQRASRVLIYLGEADDHSDSAMDAIAERKASTSAIQQKVLKFFDKRAWFSRVWVLQEVALATCALAVCGFKCVPWANFPAWWAQNAASLQDRIPPAALAYNSVASKSFLQQLHDTRASRATDPRDKVFALAAMSSVEDRPFVEPNYSKSIREIYTDVTCEIAQRQASLRILSAVQPINGQPCSKSVENLPSWVPDWSKESRLVSLGLSNHYLEPYDAGGSTALTRIERRQEADPSLCCRGIVLDIISATGKVCPIDASGNSIAQVLSEWNDLVCDVQAWQLAVLLRSELQDYQANRLEPGLFSHWRSPESHVETRTGSILCCRKFFYCKSCFGHDMANHPRTTPSNFGADTRRTG
jgi:hypothetical protein